MLDPFQTPAGGARDVRQAAFLAGSTISAAYMGAVYPDGVRLLYEGIQAQVAASGAASADAVSRAFIDGALFQSAATIDVAGQQVEHLDISLTKDVIEVVQEAREFLEKTARSAETYFCDQARIASETTANVKSSVMGVKCRASRLAREFLEASESVVNALGYAVDAYYMYKAAKSVLKRVFKPVTDRWQVAREREREKARNANPFRDMKGDGEDTRFAARLKKENVSDDAINPVESMRCDPTGTTKGRTSDDPNAHRVLWISEALEEMSAYDRLVEKYYNWAPLHSDSVPRDAWNCIDRKPGTPVSMRTHLRATAFLANHPEAGPSRHDRDAAGADTTSPTPEF